MNKLFRALAAVLLITVPLEGSRGQDNLRATLFDEADRIYALAREKQADLLAPGNFGKGLESYREAEEDFKRGRTIDQIRSKLKAAITSFSTAIEACKLAEVTFTKVMAARTDALSAGASKFAQEAWRRGEQEFNAAARELEDGDVNDARKGAGTAETFYRTAELEAIKGNYLAPARELLQRADDLDVKDTAPRTLEKARRLSAQVENLVRQNRYDTDEARQLAQDAKEEAAHAIALHQRITASKKEERSAEDLLLAGEENIRAIAAALGISVAFDAGADQPTRDIVAEISKREAKASRDGVTLKQHESELSNLKQQIASMEKRLGSLNEVEKALQEQLNRQKKLEELLAQLNRSFSPEEATILQDGNNTIIRLYGLTFPVGRTAIEPQFFQLLFRAENAIRKFPGCQVAVEGHTDSQGSDEVNQRLSEERALSVAVHLQSQLGPAVPITHHGYGETKPIASNVTPEGRAKNRRIDIVIVPAWAIIGK